MALIRAAIAAAFLIVPHLALAAANETVAASDQPAVEQVSSTAESGRLIAPAAAGSSARELEALARAPDAGPVLKPKAVRPSRLSAMPAPVAWQPNRGCAGCWYERHFVLIVGIAY